MLIANSLRSGSSFLQAIEMVVRETQPPISTEFERVIREVNLGLPFEQALANLVRRVRSDDLELMTTAISIQHQVGGNLAEILDSIAFTIRERVRIKGEIKTLTAQQRMSGYVVGFLPIGLVGILMVIAPKFMDPMFQKPPEALGLPLGVIILGIGGLMMVIGFVLIRASSTSRSRRWACRSSSRWRPPAASCSSSGPSLARAAADPVQARLSQLGSMQAKTLEEIELQQPFFERTDPPAGASACRASASASRAPRRSAAPRSDWPWPATRATCARSTSWA